jgi:transcription elongation factor GreA
MKREPITPKGHDRLVKEIEQIKHVDRPANIKAIEEARGHGDLSENADYDAAKQEQGLLQARLLAAEDRLARSEIVDPKTLSGTTIMFGATVNMVDTETDEEFKYQLVSSYEADAKIGLISIESPIGKALIGKEEGDEVIVQTPSGSRSFAVTKIQFI